MKSAPSTMPIADRAQVAALPLTLGDDGLARVLLLTSRETRRWIIPKGWPIRGLKPYEAAAREALEEAGVTGQTKKKSIGSYRYFKRRGGRFDYCRVDVYLMWVNKQLTTWRERRQREVRWFTLQEASDLVEEPGLVALLRDLALAGFDYDVPRRIEPG